MHEAVIVSGCHTLTGSFRGSLSAWSATDLGTTVVREVVNRAGIVPANFSRGHDYQQGVRVEAQSCNAIHHQRIVDGVTARSDHWVRSAMLNYLHIMVKDLGEKANVELDGKRR